MTKTQGSTALAKITDGAAATVAGLRNNGLGLQITNFDDVWRMSQVIAKSGFVPRGITTPEQVSVQIMTGLELGLSAMVAVQNIAVINNKSVIPGDLALAILLNSGLLEDHDETIEGTGEDRVAVCMVKRKGMKEVKRTFSVKDAIQAGLWDTRPTIRKRYKDKTTGRMVESNYDQPNDANWYRYPERMLTMRARGFAFRDRFSDVLKGMHLQEEFTGHTIDDVDYADVTGQHGSSISGPSAPADDIEEGEIEEAQASAPRREAAVPLADGRTIPVEATTGSEVIHGAADIPQAGSEVSGDPTDDQTHEEFDAEAWILERRVDFNQAADATVVDQIHEMFGDTAETMLNLTQREVYAAAHQEAMERTKPASGPISLAGPSAPVDEDAGDFPGNSAIDALRTGTEPRTTATEQPVDEDDGFSDAGREFDAKLRSYLEAPDRTLDSIKSGFDSHVVRLAEVIADGDVPETYEAEIRAAFRTEHQRMKAAQTGSADQGPAAAMTERMRSGLAACKSTEEVNAFAVSTLPDRNTFGKKHELYDTWKDMIAEARKSHSAIAV